MPWSIKYHSDGCFVETRYEGILRPDELRAAVAATLEAGGIHHTRSFLGDCTKLEGGHSIVDLYPLVDLVESFDSSRKLREAIILPLLSAPTKDVEYWETAVRNRGFTIRLFRSRDAAMRWLLGDGGGPSENAAP